MGKKTSKRSDKNTEHYNNNLWDMVEMVNISLKKTDPELGISSVVEHVRGTQEAWF